MENEAVCQQPVIQPAHLQTLTHTPACRHTRFPSAITLVLGCSQLYLSIYLSRFPQACMPLPLSPLSHNSRYTRSFRSRGYTCICAFSVGLCGGGYIYAFYTHSVTLILHYTSLPAWNSWLKVSQMFVAPHQGELSLKIETAFQCRCGSLWCTTVETLSDVKALHLWMNTNLNVNVHVVFLLF